MLLLAAASFWRFRENVLTGAHDFLSFYAGGRLAGSPDLYDAERNRQVQLDAAEVTDPAFRYIRPPYYAAMLWPLARLPYQTAHAVWLALGLSAVLVFVLLWRPPGFEMTLLFTCFSLPVITSLLNGQDVAFLLLWIAAAAALWRADKPFAAGLVLSLCAAKHHLLVLLPLLIRGQRAWRFGLGLLTGGAILLAGYHAYLADCAVLLPAALAVFATTTIASLRGITFFPLTPLGYFLLLLNLPITVFVPLAALALVYGMALEAGRCSASPAAPRL